MRIDFDHCVEDHQQLAHAGGDHNFEAFALGLKALAESATTTLRVLLGRLPKVRARTRCQKSPTPTGSCPRRVPNALQIWRLTLSLIDRAEPSISKI